MVKVLRRKGEIFSFRFMIHADDVVGASEFIMYGSRLAAHHATTSASACGTSDCDRCRDSQVNA
jgi:hypothetical protein